MYCTVHTIPQYVGNPVCQAAPSTNSRESWEWHFVDIQRCAQTISVS